MISGPLQQQTGGAAQTDNPQSIPTSNLQPQTNSLQQTNESSAAGDLLRQQSSTPLKVEGTNIVTTNTGSTQVVSVQATTAKPDYLGIGLIGLVVIIFMVALTFGLFRERPYKPTR